MRTNIKLSLFITLMALLVQSDGFALNGGANAFCHFSEDSLLEAGSKTIVDIGSRLELFVDDYIIEKLNGKAELRLHHPVPQEVVIVYDAPWEGNVSGIVSIFKDDDIYRMYYRGYQVNYTPFEKKNYKSDHSFFCYAESDDGIHWHKPELGLYEFQGSKANNIVLAPGKIMGVNTMVEIPWHTVICSMAVFKDENPKTPLNELYKAIIRKDGLLPLKSPDGIHWTSMSDVAVITDGAFDSQNLAFWDEVRCEYRAYWRYFTEGSTPMPFSLETWKPAGYRAIRTATSKDLLNWSEQADLRYVDSPTEHLYTNVIKPYYRAPHIFIGFPTRYIDRGWSESMRMLPEREHRELRGGREGTALTEALFMASRDGVLFKRWNEAFLRPGIEREGTWNYGHQFIGWSVVETKSALMDAPNELSFYAIESYQTGSSCALRRYTLRMDGFVSVNASMSGGELITRPLTFTGSKLALNFSSSAAGGIQVEIQDESGRPLTNFTLDDCSPVFGDTIERIVTWKNGSDLSILEGKPVRLRFVLKDADLFSLRFLQ